jgi:lactate dehydrogenase-like 2-hydroxyacid dehydrogenase
MNQPFDMATIDLADPTFTRPRADPREIVALAHPHLAPHLQSEVATRYQLVDLPSFSPAPRLSPARAVIVDGTRPLDKRLSAVLPELGLIACFNAGYDGIDVDWAAREGIAVTHAQQANHEDTADFAIGQILNVYRQICVGDRRVRNGDWQPGRWQVTRSVAGLKLGIVGLGSIRQAVARRADVLRMVTSWWGPHDKPDMPWPKATSLIDLAHDSDVLVVTASANPRNHGLISERVLHALGPEGVLVNVGRGSLVDEDALIEALRCGALGAAALDVFQGEPTFPAHWADVPNTFLSPHNAGVTDLALSRMAAMVAANLDAFFSGRPLPTPVRAA